MEQCRQSPPPLYKVGPNQLAACFLHRDQPIAAEAPAAGAHAAGA
jgi:hypothetical protein